MSSKISRVRLGHEIQKIKVDIESIKNEPKGNLGDKFNKAYRITTLRAELNTFRRISNCLVEE